MSAGQNVAHRKFCAHIDFTKLEGILVQVGIQQGQNINSD